MLLLPLIDRSACTDTNGITASVFVLSRNVCFLYPSLLLLFFSLDLPSMQKILTRSNYLMYLKVLHVMKCTREFILFFESRAANNGTTVAIIEYPPNFILDPFKEIHFIDRHARVRIDASSEWIGQVDENGRPDGAGEIVTIDTITSTILKNGKMNGYTCTSLKNRGEQEAGYYVDGLRSGTFYDANFISYEVFYKDQSLLRAYDPDHRGSHWVSSYKVCNKLSRQTKDVLPLVFDCAPTVELNGTIEIKFGMFMMNSVIQHLILNKCDGNAVINVVVNVVISQCPNLNSIEIQDEVFSKSKSCGMFWVDNCPRLEKITIRNSSLVYFSNLLLTRGIG